jgi:methylmalonyl-CoA mutase N-terminal domain/subunit
MRWQREVERKERVVVGVNEFTTPEPPPKIFRPDPAAREQVLADLARVRKERDSTRVAATLEALERAAAGASNLLDAILPAVEAYATIGEICAVLEKRFGAYQPPDVL